jgi:hypothetical protein
MKLVQVILAATAAAAIAAPALAGPTIVSYTQTNVPPSGFGYWSHNYDPITGTGTLNDGIVPNNQHNNVLVSASGASFTFQLDGLYRLSEIDILNNYIENHIPGDLASAVVTINGQSATVDVTGFGAVGPEGYHINEALLLPTSLSSLATNSFTLSGFVAQGDYAVYTAFGEVVASGTAAVPEPASWALMLGGFGAIGGALRSSRKTSLRFA